MIDNYLELQNPPPLIYGIVILIVPMLIDVIRGVFGRFNEYGFELWSTFLYIF